MSDQPKVFTWSWFQKILRLKLKFAMTSSLATAVDYILYLLLFYAGFKPVVANTISYSTGMIINFFLQKKFVFDLRRKAYKAFFMAVSVSMGGLLLSNLIIYALNQVQFFMDYQFITKLCATGMVFFYNFYFKRYVFEGRFISFEDSK